MEERLSSKEAAKMLGVQETTLRRWRTDHIGPPYYAIRHPRRIYYLREDLEQFLQGERIDPSQDAQP